MKGSHALFAAMSGSHASDCSVADWVLWAHTEGFSDIMEKAPHGDPDPGKCARFLVCYAFLFGLQAKFTVDCVYFIWHPRHRI